MARTRFPNGNLRPMSWKDRARRRWRDFEEARERMATWEQEQDRRARNRTTALTIALIFIITTLGFVLLRTIAALLGAW